MKILCIPDIHQNPCGINYAEEHINEADYIVFMGDYVDDWNSKEFWNDKKRNPINIIKRICNLKKNNNNIILLLGNHDLAYITTDIEYQRISGHQFIHHDEIKNTFKDNIDLFDIVFIADGWIFSHAGFSKEWINLTENKYKKILSPFKSYNDINKFFHNGEVDAFNFNGGIKDTVSNSGDNSGESPLWIRPVSLLRDPWKPLEDIPEIKGQIVGHTELKSPPNFLNMNNNNLIVIDSIYHDSFFFLDTQKKYNFKKISSFWDLR